ncbi:MAG: 4-alpha-glucanotransferase [Acidobacteriota bacterium]|nr:4-alpha-glucanotransferase [Acidobacteriota bacterium]
MSDKNLLERAAQAQGIELRYHDIWGRMHEASADVLRALLGGLGFAAGSDEEIARGLAEREAAERRRAIDPTLVVREDADHLRVRVPARRNGASIKLEIEWEGGELQHQWFWMPELPTLESYSVEGEEWLTKRLPLPGPPRLGYHRVRLMWMQEPELETFAEARLIVCPKRAKMVEQRGAGLAVSLYGLRSARNWGCGDFTDLETVIDAFAPAGAAFVALNPLHAIANRQPYNTSPYLPQCAFFRNFIYLDVERVGEVKLDDAMRREIAELRASEFVEYERVARLKLAALWNIFESFQAGRGPANLKQEEFTLYAQAQGQLLWDYATFCALDEEMHRRDPNVWLWTDWPVEYRDPGFFATHEFSKQHQERILFFVFLQWQIQLQAAAAHARALDSGMSIGLYHDLALATDQYGEDLWALRRFFVPGSRVGAPPDELAPSGQDWGFPPPNREEHRRNGYEFFAKSIRNAAACGGALRIDHVMRFFRLFTIPQGFATREGAYVQDYASDLLGVLALESVRGNFVVIGEDLGTVTDEVRAALHTAGVLSYRVLWFERDGAGNFRSPDTFPVDALVCSTTHDLPTLAGFPLGRDLEARKAAGLADEEEYRQQKAHRAKEVERLEQALAGAGFAGDPLGFLLATRCVLAAINQEDLSGETEQQNLPGSTWQYPNWRRKMSVPVDEIGPLARKFAAAAARSGRLPGGQS